MNMIEVKNLAKRFGEVTAVDDLTFNVAKGEEFGLVTDNIGLYEELTAYENLDDHGNPIVFSWSRRRSGEKKSSLNGNRALIK